MELVNRSLSQSVRKSVSCLVRWVAGYRSNLPNPSQYSELPQELTRLFATVNVIRINNMKTKPISNNTVSGSRPRIFRTLNINVRHCIRY
jgi:hypothetical protein